MLLHTVVHGLIMTFPEDPQGGKARYVTVAAQVHFRHAVNLHLGTTLW